MMFRHCDLAQVVGQSEPAKQLHAATVGNVHFGITGRGGVAFEEHDLDAELRQHLCEHQAHRAAARDQNLRFLQRAHAASAFSTSATIGFDSVPMPSIVTSTTSPGFIQTGGFLAAPTPPGVPITSTSPASRVMQADNSSTVSATPKIMSHVLALCISAPLRRVSIANPDAPAGTSSLVTKSGPNAPLPSKFLPTVHCGVRS